MGLDVKVEINRPSSSDTFTNGDTISGVVKLNITKSLTLTSIQVKLEGLSSTSFPVPEHPERKKDKKEVLRHDLHKFLYDSLIVFPPQNVRSVSNSKEFTLTPGSYAYNFSFKIPLNSSCKKLDGITNKFVYDGSSFDVVVNNGSLRNNAAGYISNFTDSNGGHRPHLSEQNYHEIHQLPPTFQQGVMAQVEYFVKVTCNRPSLFKVNLRDVNPFVFAPLDLDLRGHPFTETFKRSEFREVFFRRNVSLRQTFLSNDKSLPAPPKKKGLLGSILGSMSSKSGPVFSPNTFTQNLNFAFEMRLQDPPHLSPLSGANIKLLFVLDDSPLKYLSSNEKGQTSNGKGVFYVQRLIFELQAATTMSVIVTSSGGQQNLHQARADDTIPIFDNTFHNLKIDLSNAKPQTFTSATSSQFIGAGSHEVELPQKYFSDWSLPSTVTASFKTCNIQRSYSLRVIAGMSSEPVEDPSNSKETASKVSMVDVVCPDIRVLSGVRDHDPPSHGSTNAQNSGYGSSQNASYPPEKQSHNNPSAHESNEGPTQDLSQGPSEGHNSALPTYDDAMKHN